MKFFSTPRLAHISIFLILAVILSFFMVRGVLYFDEGYILHNASRILADNVIYRDFHFVYTPATLWITALAFLAFGKSILAGRILMILVALTTSFFLYKIIRQTTTSVSWSYLTVFLYIAWDPLHIAFPWPINFCILTGILTCWALVQHMQTKKIFYLFWAGVFSFGTFLFKQNFGIILLVVPVYFIFAKRKDVKDLLIFSFGYVATIAIFLLYLITTKSFIPFLNDFYTQTVLRIVSQGSLNTPLLYSGNLFVELGKLIFYLSPLLASVVCMILLARRKQKQYIFLCVFPLLFYIVGIRPTTDYIHLAPLLSLIGIPLALSAYYSQGYLHKTILVTTLILLIVGVYSAAFFGYYKWNPPLLANTVFVSSPRVNIFLDPGGAAMMRQIIRLVRTNDNSLYLFVDTYNPLVYFITDKLQPTKYDSLEDVVSHTQYQNEAVQALKSKNISVVITSQSNTSPTPINKYIWTHYHKLEDIAAMTFWKKNKN